MWDTLRPILVRAGMDPVRVENDAMAGTPDVNITTGWIELKALPDWPSRPGTPVRIPHFTPHQRLWLMRRWRANYSAWLLLRVRREWLLFDGFTAWQRVGFVPRATLCEIAALWTNNIAEDWLVAWLSGDATRLPPDQQLRLSQLRKMGRD